MERVEATENTIEVFENDIDMYLRQFQIDQNIEDFQTIPQNVWNGALIYINRHVFKPNPGVLKQKKNNPVDSRVAQSNFNAYDYDLVNDICDYYISLCMLYNKEVSLSGFSLLTGINIDTLIDWGKGSTKLSNTSCEINKKLHRFREESIAGKLADGKQNPVGLIAILNHHYGWNMPGVSRETTSKQVLPAADLPKLGKIESHIDDECASLEDKQVETSAVVESEQ